VTGRGCGATFTLTVPTMPLDLGDVAASVNPTAPPTGRLPSRSGRRQPGCRRLTWRSCSPSSGADVRVAYDGDSGLSLIQSVQPDARCSTSDAGTDGYTVCRRVRETDPDRRIVVVSRSPASARRTIGRAR
jgi:hypothetical protein